VGGVPALVDLLGQHEFNLIVIGNPFFTTGHTECVWGVN
jgi:hypothetical protein